MDEVDDEIKSVFNSIPSGMNVFFALRHIRDARENEPNLEKVFSDDQILVFIPHVDHVDVVIDGDTAFSVSKDREKWIIKDDLHIPVGDDYKEILEKSIKEGNKIPEKFQKFLSRLQCDEMAIRLFLLRTLRYIIIFPQNRDFMSPSC